MPEYQTYYYVGTAGHNEDFRGLDTPLYIDGQDGNDYIIGSGQTDLIYGGAGTDYIAGLSGDDVIYGDSSWEDDTASADLIMGTAGRNLIYAGGGANFVNGNAGDDIIQGGSGTENLEGGAGNDRVFGLGGDDTLVGGSSDFATQDVWVSSHVVPIDVEYNGNADVHFINPATNQPTSELFAPADFINQYQGLPSATGTGDDYLDGGDGNDDIQGQDGADTLIGGAGADRLDGGTGVDSMAGGAGNDTYYVDSTGDIVEEGPIRAPISSSRTSSTTRSPTMSRTWLGQPSQRRPTTHSLATGSTTKSPAMATATTSLVGLALIASTAARTPTPWLEALKTTPTTSTMPATSCRRLLRVGRISSSPRCPIPCRERSRTWK